MIAQSVVCECEMGPCGFQRAFHFKDTAVPHTKVSTLVSIYQFIQDNYKGKKKLKHLSDKKRWIREKGLKIVKHPKTGKDSVPVEDKTIMLTGTRLETKRVKEETHESKSAAKESFKKARAEYDIQTNAKATRLAYHIAPGILLSLASCHGLITEHQNMLHIIMQYTIYILFWLCFSVRAFHSVLHRSAHGRRLLLPFPFLVLQSCLR